MRPMAGPLVVARRRPPSPTGGHRRDLDRRGRCGDGADRDRRGDRPRSAADATVREPLGGVGDRPAGRARLALLGLVDRTSTTRWPAPSRRSTVTFATFADHHGPRRADPRAAGSRGTRLRAGRRGRRSGSAGSRSIDGRAARAVRRRPALRGAPALGRRARRRLRDGPAGARPRARRSSVAAGSTTPSRSASSTSAGPFGEITIGGGDYQTGRAQPGRPARRRCRRDRPRTGLRAHRADICVDGSRWRSMRCPSVDRGLVPRCRRRR